MSAEGHKTQPRETTIQVQGSPFSWTCSDIRGPEARSTEIKAITEMPRPEDVLRFNGMVNYLSRFLPNLSDVMKTLRDLTHKDVEWCWSDAQERA